MVQIHPARQSLGGAIGSGFSSAILRDLQRRGDEESQMRLLKEEAAQERQSQQEKFTGQQQFDKKTYDTIKNRFGEDEADLYRSITEGGKTDFIHKLLEEETRSKDRSQQLGIPEEISDSEENGELPTKKSIKTIDYDKGLTPAERTRRQEARYKTNLPLYTESLEKRRAAETEKEELSILEELSPQITGFQNVNINPMTGELFIPGASSEEAQRYVKTLNDFTRNAKNSYGSRVTNFDLQQFMKRLPTLANSRKAREDIIKQLQIINNIDLAHANALHNVLEEHGGIRNIDYDKALSLGEKRSSKDINKLKSEFRNIGNDIDKEYNKEIAEFKKTIPKDRVAVRTADGVLGDISKDQLKRFLSIPGNEAL